MKLLPAILSIGQMDPTKLLKNFDNVSYWSSWIIWHSTCFYNPSSSDSKPPAKPPGRPWLSQGGGGGVGGGGAMGSFLHTVSLILFRSVGSLHFFFILSRSHSVFTHLLQASLVFCFLHLSVISFLPRDLWYIKY